MVGGCAGPDTEGIVSGTVTLDGQPLKEGTIRFVPVDGKSPTADARIADGQFRATVPVGEKIVEISAPKVVGKHRMYESPDSPVVDKVIELLPPRFNVRSELRITVTKGKLEKVFTVASK